MASDDVVLASASRFRVVVYREVTMDRRAADVDSMVMAGSEIEAALMVLRSIGGGYADYVGVSAPDAVDIQMDFNGFIEETCFMYCHYSMGKFSYDVRL